METITYYAHVAAASKLGIVKGRNNNLFAPNKTISREEMAVMIVRAYEVKKGQEVTAATAEAVFADPAA